MEKCRLIGDKLFEKDLRVIWRGYSIAAEKSFDFAFKKNLPQVAEVVSPAGRIFKIFMGEARNTLGGVSEFAVAVEVAHLIN